MSDVQTRAGRVSYSEHGEGSPVLLLHGTLHDRRDFDEVAPALARTYRTIALDWPGHGRSEALASSVSATAPLLADVLEDVVEALDLPPAVLIGNSVGGFSAARLAITHPERVAGLVLVNAGGFIPFNPLSRGFCRVMGVPTVARRLFPAFIRSYMKSKTDNDRAVAARALARASTVDGARMAAQLWRSFATPGHDLRERAGELTVPTLIVWGAKDTALPLSVGRATNQAIEGSRLQILDTGHVVFSSAPREFLEQVETFIASIAATTRAESPSR
jgi:pimeloyl-ACP methyl ester carboxylesterase